MSTMSPFSVQEVLAIIHLESKFNPRATNKESTGLMQVNPTKKYSRKELLDPATNVYAGVELLNKLYDITGSMEGALVSYNIGIGNFIKHRFRKSGKKYLNTFHRSHETIQSCNLEEG